MDTESRLVPLRGRGTSANPANRFERLHFEPDAESSPEVPPHTQFFRDHSRTIIARNESPDVGFEASINPYRGCEHGCVYCYARPYHEYLGFSAGLDFETRILVKEDAPEQLRSALASPRHEPKPLLLSGVTDPYQPAERRLRVTRRVLEVLAECRHPVALITKNALVTRDVDLLARLAEVGAVSVTLSITTLDNDLQRVLEPRTSTPAKRLEAVRVLAAAGIPVGVNVAPVIPGLTDHELAAILEAAAEAGAKRAAYLVLRLPYGVKDMFETWLRHHRPDRSAKVLNRIRSLRGGALNDSRFHTRFRGEGPFAMQLNQLFHVTCRRLGLDTGRTALASSAFVPPVAPVSPPIQRGLFDEAAPR